MSPLAFVVHVAAVVLAVAGVAKLIDPTAVTRSLSAAGLAVPPTVGRVVGAGEVAVGSSVLAFGGALASAALAAWYGAFVVYLVANRARGLEVPCGCIGESNQPAGPAHLAVDLVAVAAAGLAVARPVGDVTRWVDEGIVGIGALGAIAVASAAVVVVVLPGRIGAGSSGQ
jgi:hypothetical protein